MDILDILGTSQGDAKNWVEKLKKGDVHVGWTKKVNKNLSYLSEDQIRLLYNKFTNIRNKDHLIDKLVEVFVAAEYGNDKPKFLDESSLGPDLFLEKMGQYIEVKNLNNSDDQK